MKIRFALLLLVAFTVQSCEREPYPTPNENVPHFAMTGTINGDVLNLTAGTNNLYLTSINPQNEFGVYEFISEFRETTCSNCDPVFSVTINDSSPLDPDVSSTAEVLSIGVLPFATTSGTSDFLTLNFDTQNVPNGNFSWNFGDGNSSQSNEPQHIYEAPGIYTVTLQVQSQGGPGCDVNISQTILTGSNQYISAPFHINNGPGNSIMLSYLPNLPPNLHPLNWTINGNNHQGNNIQYNIPPGPGDTEICLNYYNSEADEYGQYCITYDDGPGGNNPCMTQIHYQFESVNLNLSNVVLKYRATSGNTYKSISTLNIGQNTKFEITAVEEYPHGINGHAAKKVTAIFDAWLINEANPTETIYMENIKADFAFVY